MKKFKKLLVTLGLGVLLTFGVSAAVSAASEGELEGAFIADTSEAIVLEDYDLEAGRVLPTPPTDKVKMTASSLTSLSFKWGVASGANGYRVYIGPYKGSLKESRLLGIVKSPSCKIAKLVPDTPYTIRIQSVKLDSSNKVVDQSNKYIIFHSTTQAPRVVRVTSDKNDKFTIRMYNPAPSNKSDDIVGYRVRYENVATHSKSTHYYNKSRTGFYYKPKANYFYKLVITPYILTSKDGKQIRSYSKTNLTHYIAQQPQLSKKGHTNTSQSIGWKRVQGATSYSVYVKYPGTKSYKKVKQTTGLSYTLTGMKKGQDYLIKVVANRGRFSSVNSTFYRVRL